jgi:exoribonuclease-2
MGELPQLKVGQVLRLKLTSTSVERGFINFVLAH